MLPDVPRHTVRTPARTAGVLLTLCGVLVTLACSDDPTRQTDDVAGTWTVIAEDGAREYLRITPEEIEVHSQDLFGDCFDRVLYEILEIDGAAFRVTDQADTLTVELRRDGDDLRISVFGESLVYERSTANTSQLPLCQPPRPDAVCAELPLLPPGTRIDAALTLDDAENDDGSFHDLYRLQPEAAREIVLEMASTAVDSYLILFDEGGEIVTQNDDASRLTLNARFRQAVQPVCYIVMATSAGPGELGDYTLELNEP